MTLRRTEEQEAFMPERSVSIRRQRPVLLAVAGVLVSVVTAVGPTCAAVLKAPESVAYPMEGSPMATLSASVFQFTPPPDPPSLFPKAEVRRVPSVTFNSKISSVTLLPTAKVIFGPFRLGFSVGSLSPLLDGDAVGEPHSVSFIVEVLAKSPSQLKTVPGLIPIGRLERTLRTTPVGNGWKANVTEDVFLEAVLPGVLTNVLITATVRITPLTSFDPDAVATRSFPNSACEVVGKDDGCLKVGVQ